VSGRILPALGSTEPWGGGQVTAHAHCVLAPNPSAWTLDGTNTWLVTDPGGSRAVVVDPGPRDDEHAAAITDLAAALDVRIEAIVLTHGHADHSESARGLGQAWRVPVRAVDPSHRLGSEGLTAGAAIALGDGALRVIATAGHTFDSVCLLVEHDGVVLTGDTVLGRGTAVIAWPDGSLGEYLDSLARLARLLDEHEVGYLLPGHGPALDHPAAVIAAYREHRRLRLAEVADLVRAGIDTPEGIVAAVYRDVPREVRPAAQMSARAQLAYLADRSEGRSVTNP